MEQISLTNRKRIITISLFFAYVGIVLGLIAYIIGLNLNLTMGLYVSFTAGIIFGLVICVFLMILMNKIMRTSFEEE